MSDLKKHLNKEHQPRIDGNEEENITPMNVSLVITTGEEDITECSLTKESSGQYLTKKNVLLRMGQSEVG